MKMMKKWYALLFVAILLLSGWIFLIGKIYYYSKVDDSRPADAIVVLGASQWNGRPSPVFQARLDHAYDLHTSGVASKIILTGGVGKGEHISEAASGKAYLLEKGIREEDMFAEEKGKTSKESLDEVKNVLEKQNLHAVILVSDGFHMLRLKRMASDLGIKAYVSPVKDGPINKDRLARIEYYVRESVVYVAYLLLGI